MKSVVPMGYKQTEVGLIPDDWEVRMLEAVFSMKSGAGITSTDISEYSTFPCYGGNGLSGYTKRFTHDGNYALIGRLTTALLKAGDKITFPGFGTFEVASRAARTGRNPQTGFILQNSA